MTNDRVIDWIEENIDTADFDDFFDYYDEVKSILNTPDLTDEPETKERIFGHWLAEKEGEQDRFPFSDEGDLLRILRRLGY